MKVKIVILFVFALFWLTFTNGADQAGAGQKPPMKQLDAIIGEPPTDSFSNWTNLTVLTPCSPWGCIYFEFVKINLRDKEIVQRMEAGKVWANRASAQEQAQQDVMTNLLQAPSFVSEYHVSLSSRTNR